MERMLGSEPSKATPVPDPPLSYVKRFCTGYGLTLEKTVRKRVTFTLGRHGYITPPMWTSTPEDDDWIPSKSVAINILWDSFHLHKLVDVKVTVETIDVSTIDTVTHSGPLDLSLAPKALYWHHCPTFRRGANWTPTQLPEDPNHGHDDPYDLISIVNPVYFSYGHVADIRTCTTLSLADLCVNYNRPFGIRTFLLDHGDASAPWGTVLRMVLKRWHPQYVYADGLLTTTVNIGYDVCVKSRWMLYSPKLGCDSFMCEDGTSSEEEPELTYGVHEPRV